MVQVGGKSVVPRCMEGSSKGGGALGEDWLKQFRVDFELRRVVKTASTGTGCNAGGRSDVLRTDFLPWLRST